MRKNEAVQDHTDRVPAAPDRIRVGTAASRSTTFSAEVVAAFCAATGDDNPLHLRDDFAERTRFGRRIVNGMLTCSLVSSVIGTRLPGPGTIYLSQTFRFLAPVFLDDRITATVRALEVRRDKPVVRLGTECRKADGTLVLDGEAVVLVDDTLDHAESTLDVETGAP